MASSFNAEYFNSLSSKDQPPPGAIKIVQANNPNHVLRFTERLPMEKVALWVNEPGSPNQCWRRMGESLHPEGHPNLHLHYDPITGGFGVKMEPQRFLFEPVMF